VRWLLPLALAACAPSSQALIEVDTDAPSALFDRLRIDVLDGDGETRDSREVAVSAEQFRARQVSFGVATPVGAGGFTARLRLYRGAGTSTREPPRSAVIDGVLTLPVLEASGVRRLAVTLETENIGVEHQLEPTASASGSRVDTWDGARDQPCNGQPRSDEACVPGGAFLIGDPQIAGILPELDTPYERLVVVDAFFLDVHEVTVAEFRRQLSELVPAPLFDPVPQPATFDPTQLDSWCVWTDAAGSNEDLPLNCVGRDTARRYCTSLGKDLPSEAQLEFAASGRGRENLFAWGRDPPACGDAVWGLAGAGGATSALLSVSYDGSCLPPGSAGGPAPPGRGARDRVVLGDRTVVDLAGNLSEWVLDTWSRSTEAFWSGAGVLRNPVADLIGKDPQTASTRGGFWYGSPISLRAGYRAPQAAAGYSNGLGFRCARSAR
jgi:formylglycine-generating enzyme